MTEYTWPEQRKDIRYTPNIDLFIDINNHKNIEIASITDLSVGGIGCYRYNMSEHKVGKNIRFDICCGTNYVLRSMYAEIVYSHSSIYDIKSTDILTKFGLKFTLISDLQKEVVKHIVNSNHIMKNNNNKVTYNSFKNCMY